MLVDQLVHLRGAAADASTDAVVRDTGPSVREAHAADRDVANHQRLLDELDQRRARLQDERDQLLDRLLET